MTENFLFLHDLLFKFMFFQWVQSKDIFCNFTHLSYSLTGLAHSSSNLSELDMPDMEN